jgi:ABC-type Fe3+-hydroxamate transport system substrate-binding protein
MSSALRRLTDDTGRTVTLPPRVGRVVSLVPSLTESIAATAPDLLVGATAWCSQPPDLEVVRVGGTKNPDLAALHALQPDLVLANAEENREPDLEAMRATGLAVWVTDVRTVPGALRSLAAMLEACRLDRPAWLTAAARAWAEVEPVSSPRRAVIPIWRRPWMAVGSDTFAGSALGKLGFENVLAGHSERYPRIRPDDLPEHDLVVLPDEPYPFAADDGPEAFPGRRCALVSGRHLTWYGPSMVDAPRVLLQQLRQAG